MVRLWGTTMISYRKLRRYKYELLEDVSTKIKIKPAYNVLTNYCKLIDTGELTVYKGYAWDGASGPTYDDKTNMGSSLIHDVCYQLIREGYLEKTYRLEADEMLRDISVKNGMNKVRAWYWFQAVRKLAWFCAKRTDEPQDKVYTAPI